MAEATFIVILIGLFFAGFGIYVAWQNSRAQAGARTPAASMPDGGEAVGGTDRFVTITIKGGRVEAYRQVPLAAQKVREVAKLVGKLSD